MKMPIDNGSVAVSASRFSCSFVKKEIRYTTYPSWVQAAPGLFDSAKVEVEERLCVRPTTLCLKVDWVKQTSLKAGPANVASL